MWFAGLAALFTAPLWTDPSALVIGDELADNASFIWNFWWAQVALAAHPPSLFATDRLFAPFGTSLILHTGTPLLTVTAAMVPGLDPVTAYNVWLWLGLTLNGVCAYVLALRLTRRPDSALLAGTIFGAAPFLVVRAHGHLNVLSAWCLPLVVLAFFRFLETRTLLRAAALGAVLGVTAYIDYYYFVFATLLVALLGANAALGGIRLQRTPMGRVRRTVVVICLVGIVIAGLAAVTIMMSGGTTLRVGGRRVSLQGTFNVRVLIGFLSVIAGWACFGPTIRTASSERSSGASSAGPREDPRRGAPTRIAVIAAVAGAAILPLIVGATNLALRAEYVAPERAWRSAPRGLDLATLFLGNPLNRWYGDASLSIYERFGIDWMESVGWIGVVPAGLLLLALSRFRDRADVRAWLLPLGVFGVWSLGPYLMVLGTNTGLMLPQTALRFIPVLNNARMPTRAFAVVLLTISILAALALSHLKYARHWRWRIALSLTALTALDFWPRPFAVVALDRPAMYQQLANEPQGVVLELPVGIRDGFGNRGNLDHRSLYYQTLHGHPIVGGFVARLSDRIVRSYTNDPVLSELLAVSSQIAPGATRPLPAPTAACAIRYVVVSRNAPALDEAARRHFVLSPIAESDSGILYRVDAVRTADCATATAELTRSDSGH